MKQWKALGAMLCCAALACGCASREHHGVLSPDKITPPEPIQGNTGQYMCPYARDGRHTIWLDNALKAEAENAQASGPARGDKPPSQPDAQPQQPRPGRWDHPHPADQQDNEGKRQRAAAGIAGGFDAIRAQSELSFSSADDLCLYLYVKYSRTADYSQVFEYMSTLYPDMGHRCREALHRAAAGQESGGHGPGNGPGGGPGGMGGGPGGMGGPGGPGGMGGGGILY